MFDAVALDPPTFSQSKEHGVFRAEKDYGSWWRPRCRWSSRAEFCSPRRMRQTGRQEISRGRGKGDPLSGAENFAAALSRNRRISHQPRRAGVFENGMAKDWVGLGPASAFQR